MKTKMTFAAAATFMIAISVANAADLKVGYWENGFTSPFKAVLDAKAPKGEATYVAYADAAALVNALKAGEIDLIMDLPFRNVFTAAQSGVKMKVIAAMVQGDAVVAVPKASKIKTPADLKGKTVGARAEGCNMFTLAGNVAQYTFGVDPKSFKLKAGWDDKQLEWLKTRKVQAAVLPAIEFEQHKDAYALRSIMNVKSEWQSMASTQRAPVVAMAVARTDVLKKSQKDVQKVLRTWMNATEWAKKSPAVLQAVLQGSTYQFSEAHAKVISERWSELYRVHLDGPAMEVIETEHHAFREAGVIKGNFEPMLFDNLPILMATAG